MGRHDHAFASLVAVAAAVAVAALCLVLAPPQAGASSIHLTRYPYLTDVVRALRGTHATINWATDRSQTKAYVVYRRHGTTTRHKALVSRSAITVNGRPEYQWRVGIGRLRADTKYDYRLFFASPKVDLLGRWRSFRTPPAPGSTSPFSFAVIGDWGARSSEAGLHSQARLHGLIAASPARFVLSTGDVAYPAGTQTNYGDLQQAGTNVSAVFAPQLYKRVGMSKPLFAAPGNHGYNATTLDVWPQSTAARRSGGRYQMDTYSVPGTRTASYPSVWYAFTVGNARFYILTAAWANLNVGTGTIYSNDYEAHWTSQSPEYRWLARDLAAHPAALKFVTFHFPMYSDQRHETTDTYLHGPGSLAALLTEYNVQMVFNGHAHIYERNSKQPGESFVSYVTGGGGESLESIGPSSSFDAYGIGWNTTTGVGSATGSAPQPTSAAQVYNFLLVRVSGTTVTVTPVNSLGQAFDTVTYHF